MYNSFTKFGFFVMFFLIFCWISYLYGSNIVFSFDKIEGIAEIKNVSNNKINFTYYHQELNKEINSSTKVKRVSQAKKIQNKGKWPIFYSKNFPNKASFIGVSKDPGFSSFIVILISALPLIFFKNFNFE